MMKTRLTLRIVLFFAPLAAALLAIVGVLSYRSGSASLKDAAISEMLANAIGKEAAVNVWIEERLADLQQIANGGDLAEKVTSLLAAPPQSGRERAAREHVFNDIESYVSNLRSDYYDLFVIEPQTGKVIASTNPAEEGKAKLGHPYFENGKNDVYLQLPYHSVDLNALAMTAAIPLRTSEGKLIAVLAARVNLAAMDTIVQRRTGLRRTEDSYLVNAAGFPITQPRFMREPAVLRRKLDTEAVRHCIAQRSGVMVARDYRGVPVITVYRWNAHHNFGLIAEVGETEALAPARAFGRSVILISALALIACVGLAFLLARTITRPLRALHAGVRHFADGTSAEPLPESSGDELGLVAREFNRMALRVVERTTELAKSNAALQAENAGRKRVEEVAQRRQTELRLLIDLVPAMIFFKDTKNNLLRVNELAARSVGKAIEEIEGRATGEIYPQQAAKFYADDLEVIHSGAPKRGIIETIRDGGGKNIWLQTDKIPVCDPDGQVVGIVVMAQDITARKESEAAMESLHKKLVVASREAGMAIVATSVLHNVGNVLNSVNVSADRILEKVRRLRPASLDKVVVLLREHTHDLPDFLARDPQGKELPGYLIALVEHLAQPQKDILPEVAALRKNVEHIREIVRTQQDYARVGDVLETLAITDLVEDAIRINAAGFTRHEVQVIREFSATPPFPVEKHKVLQILVNLLSNAKYALDSGGGPHSQVTVRVAMSGSDTVRISVVDNGAGIVPENLTRIFQHGFTTRAGGHGFGLHSGALAAQELGGSLTAYSEGSGKGAVFVLELPCHPGAANS